MKKILSLKVCGTIEYVNADRNGAHIRLSVFKKSDLLNNVCSNVSERCSLDLGYWNGYDYESRMAIVIRSLREGDTVELSIEKSKGLFNNVEESVEVRNLTIEGYKKLG